jgi:hypothetical protein
MKKFLVASYQLPEKDKGSLRLRACAPVRSLPVGLRYVFIFSFVLLAACIPAKVPSNLDDTLGPAVVVSDKTFQNSQFSARYPDGWRVVTSEAQAPPSVIFVAPDNVATIQLMVGALENANFNDPKIQVDVRGLTLEGGLEITAILSAPPAQWERYSAQFERVLASIKPIAVSP